MKKFFYLGMLATFALALILVGYGIRLNETDESHIADRMSDRAVPLSGAKTSVRIIQPVIVLDTINLYSNEMIDVTALIDGRIADSFISKNSHVQRGDVIFYLVNEQIPLQIRQADSAVAKAEANLSQAVASYQRYKELIDMEATSRERFEQAQTERLAAAAALEEARAQREQLSIQNDRQNVTAPIDGEILIVYKQLGSYVTAGTPLALIGQFERLNFSVPMEDQFTDQFNVDSTVELRFQRRDMQKVYDTEYAVGNGGINGRFSATVKEITPPPGEPASMRKILFELDNRAGLLEPQTYGGVTIRSTDAKRCLTIPLSAMIGADKSEVFIVQPDNTITLRKITTGADDGQFIEVLSGLNAGDIVITSNPNGLVNGMKVDVTIGGDING